MAGWTKHDAMKLGPNWIADANSRHELVLHLRRCDAFYLRHWMTTIRVLIRLQTVQELDPRKWICCSYGPAMDLYHETPKSAMRQVEVKVCRLMYLFASEVFDHMMP